MTANMGTFDRTVRIILALVFIAAIILGWVSGVVALVAGALAAIFIVTSLVRVCPLYLPFGLRTNRKS
ncbi:YgaP family membrane protein [Reinekea blandensis]|uniref:Inner membrane protein YgaP-like transmembrane domain-containing protein n=1 Tax=Reinekea blandensis MED297 TaxID=314283 RepID=A4BDC1_9GAMM|nr:DUF2892 domain-containing protein [Reinekea blandensis]EAR09865.1 hypothetical protein MED297_05934 [Reinekea sp. MED297] [Reinekea blandensis MED297]